MYSPMTAIEVAARYAVVFHSDGSTMIVESVTHSQIELVGVPVRGLTCFQIREPGSAPSREKAYDIREFAVTEAMPQNHCATMQMKTRNVPALWPAASMKIWAGGRPSAVVRSASSSWIDQV